jgi:hypothetical protein
MQAGGKQGRNSVENLLHGCQMDVGSSVHLEGLHDKGVRDES